MATTSCGCAPTQLRLASRRASPSFRRCRAAWPARAPAARSVPRTPCAVSPRKARAAWAARPSRAPSLAAPVRGPGRWPGSRPPRRGPRSFSGRPRRRPASPSPASCRPARERSSARAGRPRPRRRSGPGPRHSPPPRAGGPARRAPVTPRPAAGPPYATALPAPSVCRLRSCLDLPDGGAEQVLRLLDHGVLPRLLLALALVQRQHVRLLDDLGAHHGGALGARVLLHGQAHRGAELGGQRLLDVVALLLGRVPVGAIRDAQGDGARVQL